MTEIVIRDSTIVSVIDYTSEGTDRTTRSVSLILNLRYFHLSVIDASLVFPVLMTLNHVVYALF